MRQKLTYRVERIAEQLMRELAKLLQFHTKDPRIGKVTITHVEVSKDLFHAKIFFSVFNENKKEESLKGLKSATPFLRSQLGKMMQLRILPELHFIYDESIVYGQKITMLIERALEKDSSEHKYSESEGPQK